MVSCLGWSVVRVWNICTAASCWMWLYYGVRFVCEYLFLESWCHANVDVSCFCMCMVYILLQVLIAMLMLMALLNCCLDLYEWFAECWVGYWCCGLLLDCVTEMTTCNAIWYRNGYGANLCQWVYLWWPVGCCALPIIAFGIGLLDSEFVVELWNTWHTCGAGCSMLALMDYLCVAWCGSVVCPDLHCSLILAAD